MGHGKVETMNKFIVRAFSVYNYVENCRKWDTKLPGILFAFRTSQKSHLEASPFQILLGRNPRTPTDALFEVESEKSLTEHAANIDEVIAKLSAGIFRKSTTLSQWNSILDSTSFFSYGL
jgi:hypothetical protein